jgi:sigma-B regulation protein RsbU (phosphoserine phosphatase)
LPSSDLAAQRDRAFADQSCAVEKKLARLRLGNNRLQLESGDHVVLFTDRVTEAEDAHGEEFGEERVVRDIQNAAGRSAEEVRRVLMAAVTGYCSGQFRDDAAVVVLAVE